MHSVICLWQYNDKAQRKWELVEAFPVDDDGYAIGKTTNISGEGHQCWDEWMCKDDVEFMGRAITFWDTGHGVQLMDFNPPEWVRWLSVAFVDLLKIIPNWHNFFEDGYSLYLGTQEAVKLMFDDKNK